jgi:hypothetical protein
MLGSCSLYCLLFPVLRFEHCWQEKEGQKIHVIGWCASKASKCASESHPGNNIYFKSFNVCISVVPNADNVGVPGVWKG